MHTDVDDTGWGFWARTRNPKGRDPMESRRGHLLLHDLVWLQPKDQIGHITPGH